MVEGPLGQPPFEKISICKAVTNLLLYKFSHLSHIEWGTMSELAKLFLHCLNTWSFPAPCNQRQRATQEEASIYKIAYTRYFYNDYEYVCVIIFKFVFMFVDGLCFVMFLRFVTR